LSGKKLQSAAVFLAALLIITILWIPVSAEASDAVAVYTAPNGFKVVSYARTWSDINKLKSVYEELLRNTHGEEFKLLTKINIYPGPDSQGSSTVGKWYGVWTLTNGQPHLAGNRYIDIYNGQDLTTVSSIARTLAHEYGHHFTYYYYFKKEKKSWESWRTTGLAAARGLKSDSRVKAMTNDHNWSIEEIVAEDYVQLFGSPSAKISRRYKDLLERLHVNETILVYSTDTFNYSPQENYRIPLASRVKGLKEYWLKASGITDKYGSPPTPNTLQLSEVNQLNFVPTPQYVFSWTKSTDDKTAKLEYTLVCFEQTGINNYRVYPVKTVYDDEPLEAIIGAARDSSLYVTEDVPSGLAYYVVYIKDGDGLVTSSQIFAVDFSEPLNPDTVLISDTCIPNGLPSSPQVKVHGKQLKFDVPPVNQNGRVLVPLRSIFEELGADVRWDEQTQTITAQLGVTELTLHVGKDEAEINGERITLDVPPQIKNGMTLGPLRFISEALGAEVKWNNLIQLASIN